MNPFVDPIVYPLTNPGRLLTSGLPVSSAPPICGKGFGKTQCLSSHKEPFVRFTSAIFFTYGKENRWMKRRSPCREGSVPWFLETQAPKLWAAGPAPTALTCRLRAHKRGLISQPYMSNSVDN